MNKTMAATTAMLSSVILYKKYNIAFIETDAAFLAALLLHIQWCETTAALGMTSMTLHTGTLWAFLLGGLGGLGEWGANRRKKKTLPRHMWIRHLNRVYLHLEHIVRLHYALLAQAFLHCVSCASPYRSQSDVFTSHVVLGDCIISTMLILW